MDQILDIFSTLLGLAIAAGVIWFIWHLWTVKSADDESAEDQPPKCSDCGYDLRGSPNRCPECGAIQFDRREYLRSLREDWPDSPIAPRRPVAGEEMIILVSSVEAFEAELLRDQLQARGIAALLQASELRQHTFGGLEKMSSFMRVLVYEADLEMAKNYLWRARGIPKELLEEINARTAGQGVAGERR